MGKLVLTRQPEETIILRNRSDKTVFAIIGVESVKGKNVRVSLEAHQEVEILRREVYDQEVADADANGTG